MVMANNNRNNRIPFNRYDLGQPRTMTLPIGVGNPPLNIPLAGSAAKSPVEEARWLRPDIGTEPGVVAQPVPKPSPSIFEPTEVEPIVETTGAWQPVGPDFDVGETDASKFVHPDVIPMDPLTGLPMTKERLELYKQERMRKAFNERFGHDPKPQWFTGIADDLIKQFGSGAPMVREVFRDSELWKHLSNGFMKTPIENFSDVPTRKGLKSAQWAIQRAFELNLIRPYGSDVDPIAAKFGGPEFGLSPQEREDAIVGPLGELEYDPTRGRGKFGIVSTGDLSDPEVRASVIAELEKANLPIDSQKVINYLTENENQLDEREGLTDTEKRVNDLMTTLNAGTGGQGGDLGLSVTQLFQLSGGYADAVKKAMGQWTVADAKRVGDDRDPEAVNGTLSLDFVRQLPVPPEVLGQFTINLSNLVTQFLEQEYRRTLLEPEERLVYERRAEQFARDLRTLDDELIQSGFDRRQTELQRTEQIRQANLEVDLRREQMRATQQSTMFQAALQNPYAFAAFQQMQGGVNPFQAALANLGFQVPGAQMPTAPGLPSAAAMPAPMPTPQLLPGTGFDVDPMMRGVMPPVGIVPSLPPTGPTQLLPGTGFDVDPMMRGVIPPVGIVPAPAPTGPTQLLPGTGFDVNPMMRGVIPRPPPTGPTQLLPGTGFDVDPVIRGDQPFVAPLPPTTLGPTPGTVYGTGPDVPPMLRGEPIAPYVAPTPYMPAPFPTPQQPFVPPPPMAGQVYGTGFDIDPMMRGQPIAPYVAPTPYMPAPFPTPQQPFVPPPPMAGQVYGTGFDIDPMMRGQPIQPLSLPTPQQRPQGTLQSMPQFGRMPTYGQASAFFPEVGLPTIGALRQTDPESIEYLNAMLGYGGVSPRQFAQQVAGITPQVATPVTGGFGRAATRLGMGR
jgi:hypothetical protein